MGEHAAAHGDSPHLEQPGYEQFQIWMDAFDAVDAAGRGAADAGRLGLALLAAAPQPRSPAQGSATRSVSLSVSQRMAAGEDGQVPRETFRALAAAAAAAEAGA